MEVRDSDRPWASAVATYLKRLQEQLREQPGSGQTVALTIGRERLLVRPYEQRLFPIAEVTEPASSCDALSLDSLGFQMGVLDKLNDLVGMRGGDNEAIAVILEHLHNDLEIGFKLAQRLTTEMHVMRENGQVGEANRLADSRTRLDEVLRVAEKGVRDVSPEGDGDEASRFAYDFDAMVDKEEVKRRAKEALARREATVKKERKLSQQSKLILAAVAVVALFVSVSLSWYFTVREVKMDSFSASEFNDWYGIEEVVSRPPQILIIVSQEQWDKLGPARKEDALAEVVEKVEPAGYKMVEIRSVAKGRLAKWEDGEVEVLE